MAYKKIDQYFSFADIAIQNNVDKNRSLIFLNKVDQPLNGNRLKSFLQNITSLARPIREKEPHIPAAAVC